MSAAADAVTIRLDAVNATDAFGLDVEIEGSVVTETIFAEGPGIFSALDLPGLLRIFVHQGWVVGFLQRGPLRLPIIMPCDGWVLAAIADDTRVEHGTPLIRMLCKTEGIVP